MATEYNEGFSDAQSVNNSSRSTYLYKDLNLFFTPNPVTSDVSTVTDVQNIKRAVKTARIGFVRQGLSPSPYSPPM